MTNRKQLTLKRFFHQFNHPDTTVQEAVGLLHALPSAMREQRVLTEDIRCSALDLLIGAVKSEADEIRFAASNILARHFLGRYQKMVAADMARIEEIRVPSALGYPLKTLIRLYANDECASTVSEHLRANVWKFLETCWEAMYRSWCRETRPEAWREAYLLSIERALIRSGDLAFITQKGMTSCIPLLYRRLSEHAEYYHHPGGSGTFSRELQWTHWNDTRVRYTKHSEGTMEDVRGREELFRQDRELLDRDSASILVVCGLTQYLERFTSEARALLFLLSSLRAYRVHILGEEAELSVEAVTI